MTNNGLIDGDNLPVLGFLCAVLFPGMQATVRLGTDRSVAAIRAGGQGKSPNLVAVFSAPRGFADEPNPNPNELARVGALARVIDVWRRPGNGLWVAELEGVERIRRIAHVTEEPYWQVRVAALNDYSVGVVLYEMLIGIRPRPFVRPIMAPSRIWGNVLPSLDHFVTRLLSLRREDRPSTAYSAIFELDAVLARYRSYDRAWTVAMRQPSPY